MKSLLAEFKEFINRGNVIDMAVGIIIGAAFTAIVTSLTDDIINPLIKLITGGNGTDVAGLTIPVAGTANGIDFGAFRGDTEKAREAAKELRLEIKESDTWGNI